MSNEASRYSHLMSPFNLKGLRLKNRIIVTAHAPGYAENGLLTTRLQTYHLQQARGGASLIMFGGSSSVSADGLGSFGMLDVSNDRIIPYFQGFARKIHDEGAGTICQITHMGRRARWDSGLWTAPIAPSRVKEPAHRSYPRTATVEDIRRIVQDFGDAAARCQQGGLDGVELAYHSQQLAAQFWSPTINHRTDKYGGSLANRMRFSLEVLEEVRRRTGSAFIISVRISADELVRGGLTHQQCLEIAEALAKSDYVDILNVLGSQAGDWVSAAKSMANMAFPEAPYLHLAAAVRRVSGLPVIHAQRILTLEKAEEAVRTGSVDLVGMTRSHVADPDIVRKMLAGEESRIRPCVGANYCINRIYTSGEMLCLHNPATGRELTVSQQIAKASTKKEVIVVGGGPAGLEAARVAARRGHHVTLFEANDRCGGQVNIAASAAWRGSLGQVTAWLEKEVRLEGVEIRLNRKATANEIVAAKPDIVVVATGGTPSRMGFELEAPISTPTDLLSDLQNGREMVQAYNGQKVLIFDNVGNHKALSAAEVLANAGAHVEVVTPERYVGIEVGNNDMPIHSEHLYKKGVIFTTDHNLASVVAHGNAIKVVLSNLFTDAQVEREVAYVLIEDGVIPHDELYHTMRPMSSNLGQTDPNRLLRNEPQDQTLNPNGNFQLFLVGDAVASRNIHAALFDSLRIMKDL